MTARAAARLPRRLGASLRSLVTAPESALMVVVPAARHLLPPGPDGRRDPVLPPHVTVLSPFLPPRAIGHATERALAELLGGHTAFEFALTGVGRFRGVLFVRPEPEERFVALTEAVCRRWPALRPYEGRFPRAVPHLTVAIGPEPPALAAAVQGALPVTAVASEVALMVADRRGRWSCRRSFPLAPTAVQEPRPSSRPAGAARR